MLTGDNKQDLQEQTDNERLVATLSRQLKEQELSIQILSAQLAAKEARLNEITGSLGWQVVNRYSWLKYYLGPVFGWFAKIFDHEVSATTTGGANAEAELAFPPPVKYDVICFPIIDWNFRFQRPQQLLTLFAKDGHRVFYISCSFQQSNPQVLARRLGENIFELQLPGPSHVGANLHGLSKATLEKLINALAEFRNRAAIAQAVSLVHVPFWAPLAFSARAHWGWKLVYDCMDEHSGFANVRRTALLPEQDLIQHSDLVVATSRILHDKISGTERAALLLPNAVDFDYFHHPGPLRLLDKIGRPIIGYYGAISHWFDVTMIEQAAKHRPDWQFVLIGDTAGAKVGPLSRLANVHMLGEQPYITLSSYLKDFDVACIPFLHTSLTRATNPVKFYEYLSAGKPVVSVQLPELEPYQEYFYPVRSREEFVPQIEAALGERSAEKVNARIDLARRNTWLHRYKILSEKITGIASCYSLLWVSLHGLTV